MQLSGEFIIKDLGTAKSILEIRNGKIYLDQTVYIVQLLDKLGMKDCAPASTPFVVGKKLKNSDTCDNNYSYQELGSLNCLAVCTRPDIAFSVNYLSRFNNDHSLEHWLAVKWVLSYLKAKPICDFATRKRV